MKYLYALTYSENKKEKETFKGTGLIYE